MKTNRSLSHIYTLYQHKILKSWVRRNFIHILMKIGTYNYFGTGTKPIEIYQDRDHIKVTFRTSLSGKIIEIYVQFH